jgi:hypothetical protein
MAKLAKNQKIVHIEKNPRSNFWGFLLFILKGLIHETQYELDV